MGVVAVWWGGDELGLGVRGVVVGCMGVEGGVGLVGVGGGGGGVCGVAWGRLEWDGMERSGRGGESSGERLG